MCNKSTDKSQTKMDIHLPTVRRWVGLIWRRCRWDFFIVPIIYILYIICPYIYCCILKKCQNSKFKTKTLFLLRRLCKVNRLLLFCFVQPLDYQLSYLRRKKRKVLLLKPISEKEEIISSTVSLFLDTFAFL